MQETQAEPWIAVIRVGHDAHSDFFDLRLQAVGFLVC